MDYSRQDKLFDDIDGPSVPLQILSLHGMTPRFIDAIARPLSCFLGLPNPLLKTPKSSWFHRNLSEQDLGECIVLSCGQG
jgi:hypothetical protein